MEIMLTATKQVIVQCAPPPCGGGDGTVDDNGTSVDGQDDNNVTSVDGEDDNNGTSGDGEDDMLECLDTCDSTIYDCIQLEGQSQPTASNSLDLPAAMETSPPVFPLKYPWRYAPW